MRRQPTAHTLAVGVACCAVLGLVCVGIAFVNSRFLDALNHDIAPPSAGAHLRVLLTFERCSRWEYFDASRVASPLQRWFARAEHASPLHVSARTALTAGVDKAGPCGASSRSMIVLLRRAGISARRLILHAPDDRAMHTVVEVLLDGEWRVFDPTYGWYWTRPGDGEIATARDLEHDPVLLSSILEKHPGYPIAEYRYDRAHHLRWNKIPGLDAVRRALTRAGAGTFVRNVGTPPIYERPLFLLGDSLLMVAAVLAASAWSISRRAARRGVAV